MKAFNNKDNHIPRVSILTPTWNRQELLTKVYTSLVNQTVHNFEWIVVDDGSDDKTQIVMQRLLEKATFPVTFVSYDKRVGKCRADNTLLDLAQTDKVLWCDSDDILVPDAIEKMLAIWDAIPPQKQNEYIAVIALCIDPNGHIQSTGSQNFVPFSCSWQDLSNVHGMAGDMCIMQNRNLIGNTRFLEVDLVMSESGFWRQFMDKTVICIPDPLKIMTRTTENRISRSSKMEYCRGKAHAILLADKEYYPKMSLKRQIKTASNLIRYAIHGDLKLREIKTAFGSNQTQLPFQFGAILGKVLAIKDSLQGRVYKTHLIFEEGQDATSTVIRNQRASDILKKMDKNEQFKD